MPKGATGYSPGYNAWLKFPGDQAGDNMPLYDYHCPSNGQTIEVVHGISKRFETWGELCEYAKLELGDTPADSPVQRLVGSGSATNMAATTSKQLKAHGEASKSLKHGPMAAPMRTTKF